LLIDAVNIEKLKESWYRQDKKPMHALHGFLEKFILIRGSRKNSEWQISMFVVLNQKNCKRITYYQKL
jgi:hypothetical protein